MTYKLKGLLPISKELKNSVVEKGAVQEGVTTIIYRYALQVKAPTLEVPEYEGGVSPVEPPVLEVPEYEGGVSPIEPPVLEVPEYNGGVSSPEPPVLEVPEYKGGVSSTEPPVLEVPKFEGGASSVQPPVLELPEYKGGVPSNRPAVLEVPEYRGSALANTVESIPNPKEQLQNLPTVEKLEEKILTLSAVNRKKSERLPNTGAASSDVATTGFMMMLAALGMGIRKRRKEK